MKKMKIGVFGGSFDPIHLGHLYLAEQAYQQLKLDMVLFVPSGDPYHKHEPVATKGQRCEMVKRALTRTGNPHFRLSRVDVNRKGPTYSVDTAKELKAQFGKEARLIFLIGADNLNKIRTWKNFRTFLNLTKIVAVPRPGTPSRGEYFFPKTGSQRKTAHVMPCQTLNISSKQIRKELKEHISAVQYKLPARVWRYIQRERLYLL